MQQVVVCTEDQSRMLGTSVEVADTAFRRLIGLLGRKALTGGGGLLIRPSSGVHTFFMLFPIDVVGLDKERRVVRLWKILRPWRVTKVSLEVRTVLELPAGQIAACGVQLGDKLQIIPREKDRR